MGAETVRPNDAPVAAPRTSSALNLLAYVHLRNIHDSTGAGRVARQLTEHLAQREDINLRVLADAGDRERVLPLVQEPWTSYRYHTFSRDTSRQQARWFALGSPVAESFWPEAQVVYCTGESYVPVKRARLAVTLHDAAYFEASAHRRDGAFLKQRLKWKLLFHVLSRRADMFHTVSQFSADRIAHFFPAMRSRLQVVPNAVSPHFFRAPTMDGEAYLATQGLAGRRFVLVPGGLHFRKNAELILEAAPRLLERFPDLILAVVNHSNPEYVARAGALGPNARMLGFVSDDALRSLYGSARVVWFPSRYEGFGLPVIEAMACGAPVVASNSSSIPEVAGAAALLVDPTAAKDHLAALEHLLTDDGARDELAVAGRTRASAFTWSESAAKLRAAFGRLI